MARLHEVGHVYVAADVLAGLDRVPSPERAAAHDAHYEAGYRLALGAGAARAAAAAWLLRARERFDGGGPEGLAGDAIALGSRIIRAACLCQTTLATPAAPGGAGSPQSGRVEALRERAGTRARPGRWSTPSWR